MRSTSRAPAGDARFIAPSRRHRAIRCLYAERFERAECWVAEVGAWRTLRASNKDARIYYRRREHNSGHKSGNIAAFCQNWGTLYDYMVVLDADSLMTGHAARPARRPDGCTIRASRSSRRRPLLVGGESLFARMQQFASWVYGPVYVAGLARLTGEDGNYWGHNAIIRVKPFMENCGLPILPGRPPLGGEILSHDFVEAALLRRAGWEVRMAPEIAGSFEESPPTLIDYLKRDRRWCQGNLQHVKLIFAQGLRTSSRLHFALGAMSYLASPLWLIAVVLFCAHALRMQNAAAVTYEGRYPVLNWPMSHSVAFVSIAVATLGDVVRPEGALDPRAVARTSRPPAMAARFGSSAAFSIESVLSVLLAPVFMLSHSWFVANILIGRTTRWATQPRGSAGISLRQAVTVFAPHSLDSPDRRVWRLALAAGRVLVVPSLPARSGRGGSAGLADQQAQPRACHAPARIVSCAERNGRARYSRASRDIASRPGGGGGRCSGRPESLGCLTSTLDYL